MAAARSQVGPVILWSFLLVAALAPTDIILGRGVAHAYSRHQLGGVLALALLLLVVHLAGFFLAGLFAGHGARSVRAGASAAMLAALVSGLCARAVTAAPFTFARHMQRGLRSLPGSSLLTHGLALLVITLAISTLGAACMGALGAAAARRP
ncbi:MAG TPA: hypothetical protein VGR88_06075 [Ktedonobacterales bacterium]|nr:hypothetical protein [Ktedonobacterales bacterium]